MAATRGWPSRATPLESAWISMAKAEKALQLARLFPYHDPRWGEAIQDATEQQQAAMLEVLKGMEVARG